MGIKCGQIGCVSEITKYQKIVKSAEILMGNLQVYNPKHVRQILASWIGVVHISSLKKFVHHESESLREKTQKNKVFTSICSKDNCPFDEIVSHNANK